MAAWCTYGFSPCTRRPRAAWGREPEQFRRHPAPRPPPRKETATWRNSAGYARVLFQYESFGSPEGMKWKADCNAAIELRQMLYTPAKVPRWAGPSASDCRLRDQCEIERYCSSPGAQRAGMCPSD